ncbi:MAG: putative beta-lysine N-acetyltransferase [Smithella sp.]
MNDHVPDIMEKLPCGSLIQHGPYNNRIYLLKVGNNATEKLPLDLIELAKRHGYSKVFVKVPEKYSKNFTNAGYIKEASIPGFYRGNDKGIFMGYYLNCMRSSETDTAKMEEILRLARSKSGTMVLPLVADQFLIRPGKKKDIFKMANIYRNVFTTYPFPIYDSSYLWDTMQRNTSYYVVEVKGGDLVALSSAEIDASAQNAEMTDFAILSRWRQNNLSLHLLLRMEKEIKQKDINTVYTIARAMSPGMNITFSKLGYIYGGRLKNNTNISARIESMNVWYKTIS